MPASSRIRSVVRIILAVVATGSVLTAFAQGKGDADEILKAYRTSHGKKDVAGLMELVLFQSGGATEKSNWRNDFEAETRAKVTAKLVPLSDYAAMLSPESRKRIRPSITLVSWLVVEFPAQEKPGQANQRSALYPIGKENNRFFIIGP